MHARLKEAPPERAVSEMIALVGIGCRFPGGVRSSADLWSFVRDGREAVTGLPPERAEEGQRASGAGASAAWQRAALLDDVDQFDAAFFGVRDEEALAMDPQQCLLLEVAWEALEDSDRSPGSLAGTRTGVFVGIGNSDYDRIACRDLAKLGAHSGPGTSYAVAAARISYMLDLRGPSLALDTGCSSSLVAVHLACQSLRTRETDCALVGGVNIILSPEKSVALSQAGILSPSGKCRTFDRAADGYVRGEGCGVVVLKRLSDAVRDGDRVRAVLRGSAVNHNGLSNGITAPNGRAQRDVVRAALRDAGCAPSEISYVEVHGTGTPVGDAMEFNALCDVMAEGRPPDSSCAVGSLKPNLGHLEPASGIAALIKAVVSLEQRTIPPHVGMSLPNERLRPTGAELRIPRTAEPWSSVGPRRAGVSAFSFAGTNAHAVIEESPTAAVRDEPGAGAVERSVHVFVLSAKSAEALGAHAQRQAAYLETAPAVSLEDVCFTANARASAFAHRAYVVADTLERLRDGLRAVGAGQAGARAVPPGYRPRVGLLCGAGECFDVARAEQLARTFPSFAATLEEIERARPGGGSTPTVDLQPWSPALLGFACQVALARAWRGWGVDSSAVLGHGPVGELVAAHLGGAVSLSEALGRLVEASVEVRRDASNGAGRYAALERVASAQEPAGRPAVAPDVWLSLGSSAGSAPGGALESPLPGGDVGEIASARGELFVRGHELDWRAMHAGPARARVPLPFYPFRGKRRLWTNPPIEDATEPVRALVSRVEASTVNALTDRPARKPMMPSDEGSRARADEALLWLRGYAEERLNSRLMDERRSLAPYVVLDLGNRGLLGMQVPLSYGGLELSTTDAMRVMAQMGAIDTTLASFIGVNNFLGVRPIARFASDALRDELLGVLGGGRELASFAFTEPGAGSDPRAITTTARPGAPGRFVIDGDKVYIGSANWAGVINVFARQLDARGKPNGLSAFAVAQRTPGMRHGPEALTMGIRAMPQNAIELRGLEVDERRVLGAIGAGMVVAEDAMNSARLAIAAASVGGMKRSLQLMLRYATRRKISTGRLLDNPVSLARLTSATAMLGATEALVSRVAQLSDEGVDLPTEVYAACKASGPEFFWTIADWTVQLLGGRGYIETNVAPQILRDARIGRIFEGPTETMRMFIGSRLIKYPESARRIFGEHLSAAPLWGRLEAEVGELSELADAHRDRFGSAVTARAWSQVVSGELGVFALLEAAAVDAAGRAGSGADGERLLRGADWARQARAACFEQARRTGSAQAPLRLADALSREVEAYAGDVGDVQQSLAGEGHELDALLRVDGASATAPRRAPERALEMPEDAVAMRGEQPARSRPGQALGTDVPRDRGALSAWLVQWCVSHLELPASSIDTSQPFSNLGLDSNDAVRLARDLGQRIGLDLDATLAWNFPSIDSLSEHLAVELEFQAGSRVARPSAPASLELEGLTEEEALALLQAEVAR
jgi:alkylation response protein AidB-like acyl-CoA dehydrogenase/3-oxoacyl-(acyl-carrier-protein) synthase/acyl carrier protein